MKNTGATLKAEREKQKLSLHEIGMSLKINPKTLQAMEDGDLSKLPARSFLRGFVKSYAKFLKMNSDQVLEQFQKEMDLLNPQSTEVKPEAQSGSPSAMTAQQPIKTTPIDNSTIEELNEDRFMGSKFFVFIGVTVIVSLILLTSKLVEKYQREKIVDRNQIESLQTQITSEPSLETTSNTPPPIETTPPAQPEIKADVLPPVQEKKPVETVAVVPTPAPPVVPAPAPAETKPAEVKIPTQLPEKVVKPAETTSNTPPPPTTTTNTQKPTEVIVEALNDVKITFSLGDGKTQMLDLKPDQIHTFKSKSVVELEFSDGGSVNLIVNGRERGVPGTLGKPIKVTYPKL